VAKVLPYLRRSTLSGSDEAGPWV